MKNIIFLFSISFLAISCNPSDIKKTKDTIASADSLFTTAKKQMKTLDSISKTISDTTKGINVKKIQKELEKGNIILPKNSNLDSLAKLADKISKTVVTNEQTKKIIDSVANKVNNTSSATDVLTTISKAVDQLNNKSEAPKNKPVETNKSSEKIHQQPIIQTARLSFETDTNISNIDDILQSTHATIVSEITNNDEGKNSKEIVLNVPYNQFDRLIAKLENTWGAPSYKTIESTGEEVVPEQLCKVKITVSGNKNNLQSMTSIEIPNHENKEEKGIAGAWQKGWTGLYTVALWIIPFWPLILLLMIIGYFIIRIKKKKLANDNLAQKKNDSLEENTTNQQDPNIPTTNQNS